MKLLMLLALCGLVSVAYMKSTHNSTTSSTTPIPHCDPTTPCAWSVYNYNTRVIGANINNTYCVCGPGMQCIATSDDVEVSSYIHNCRPEGSEPEISIR